MNTLWFASGNVHKKEELSALLNSAGFEGGLILKTPGEAGIEFDPEETGNSFFENAMLKARELYKIVRAPVIADDSGLCVDALQGRPGIFSARYGNINGKKLESDARNALLLNELGSAQNRRARFVCAMVLLLDENRFFSAQETLEGEITREAHGAGGFGYDPIMLLPEKGRTVAELDSAEKNLLSHRGKAARALAAALHIGSR